MSAPRVHKPLAGRLQASLAEGLRHDRGAITLRTNAVELPDEPPEIDAPTLVANRDQSRMSQAVFARLLNVSTQTVPSWEQGVRIPSHASRRLIQIDTLHPEAVCQSVGLPPITLQGVSIEQVAPGQCKIVVTGTASQGARSGPSTRRIQARTVKPTR